MSGSGGQLVRVASYNVSALRGGVDQVAEALAAEVPDLALVQDCGPKPGLARLAELLDMERVSSHRPFNPVRNAVLYRHPWRVGSVEVRDLSRLGGTIRRGFVAASLRGPGFRITAVSAHLGSAAREREEHARELTDYLGGIDGPRVMGIDLNETPDGPAARWIADRFFDAFGQAGEGKGETLPARSPAARIDFIFASEEFTVAGAWVPGGSVVAAASEHRPVLAELELGRP